VESRRYGWVADVAVPRLVELGFKRVMIVLGMAPWNSMELSVNMTELPLGAYPRDAQRGRTGYGRVVAQHLPGAREL